MPSRFVWYELHTADPAAAEAFYKPVLGWSIQDAGMPDRSYPLLSVAGIPIGGMLPKPGAATAWLGYIGVEDVDAFSGRVQQAGGTLHRAPEDIPGVGRFAVVADPQGAIFVLFQPAEGQQAQFPAPGTPGAAAWHDLVVIEWQSAFAFYADLFGWTHSDTIDMGPGGVYQIFAVGHEPIGGMITRMDPSQPPAWLFYFFVEDIHAAIGRAQEHGGTLTHGPSPVPGGQQIAHILDPQGAMFGIVTPRG